MSGCEAGGFAGGFCANPATMKKIRTQQFTLHVRNERLLTRPQAASPRTEILGWGPRFASELLDADTR